MANIKLGELFWEFTAKLDKFFKGIADSQKKMQDFGKKLTNIGKELSLKVTAPILAIAAASIKSAADFESQTVAFETLLGSAEKAQVLLQQIEDFSATTPFQLPGLIEGSKRLLAFGIAQDEIVEKLRNLGNAAQGNQAILDRLTLAYGKVQAKGRASLEELNMFTEAGVPIMKALADQYGVTTQELFKLVETGKVGFEDVDNALTALTTGSGQFAGLIEKQSQTFSGALSTFKDNLSLAGRSLVEDLLPPLTDMLRKATEIVQGFKNLDEGSKRLILTIAGVTAVIGPLSLAIGAMITFFTGPAGIIFAITAAATALGLFIIEGEKARQAKLDDTFGAVAEAAGVASQEVKDIVGAFEIAEEAGTRMAVQVAGIAEAYGISKAKAIELALTAGDLTEETRKQLIVLRGALSTQESLLDAEAAMLGSASDRSAIATSIREEREATAAAALVEAEAERELAEIIEARRLAIEEEYLSARELVLGTLESERTEYDRILEQMNTLVAHPWAGGVLEAQRLEAIEILQQRLRDLRDEEIRSAADQFDALGREGDEFRTAEVDAAKEVEEELDKLREERKKKERKAFQEQVEGYVQLAQSILGIAGTLDSALDQFDQNEITRLENKLETEIAAMEAAGATEEEINDARQANREEVDAQEKQLQREAFARKKAIAVAETLINTAAAIIGFLFNPGGFAGIGLSVAAGIAGAVQLAAIASTPPPALAQGGIMPATPGGRLAQLGEGGSDEAVIPLNDQGIGALSDALAEAVPAGGENERTLINRIEIPDLGVQIDQRVTLGLRNGEIIMDAQDLTNLDQAVGSL